MRIASIPLLAVAIACAALIGGCASLPSAPSHLTTATPRFDPIAYFTGPTQSWGVIENRAGDPKSRFRCSMFGRRDGNGLAITQDFTFDDGRKQQRFWKIERIDEHRFDATSPDVIGIATGYAYGNSFHWEYTLQLKPGNALSRVHMKHWMYLADDGDLMINRVVISKLGIVIAETTEYFRRGTPR